MNVSTGRTPRRRGVLLFVAAVVAAILSPLTTRGNAACNCRYGVALDAGTRVQYHRDFQVYSLDLIRAGLNTDDGTLTAIVNLYSIPLVQLRDEWHYSLQLLPVATGFALGTAVGVIAGKRRLMQAAGMGLGALPSSQLEIHLNRYFKVVAGVNTEFLLFKSRDGNQGLTFTPRMGIDIKLWAFRLTGSVHETRFIDFNRPDEDIGTGFTLQLYSGWQR